MVGVAERWSDAAASRHSMTPPLRYFTTPTLLLLSQIRDGVLHFIEMDVRGRIVRDVRDLAICPDQDADAPRHVLARHPRAKLVGNLSLAVHEQGKVEVVFRDEFLVAFPVVEANPENLHIVLLKVGHAIAETARFLCATGRVVFGVKVK